MRRLLQKGIVIGVTVSLCLATGCTEGQVKTGSGVQKKIKQELPKGGYAEQDIELFKNTTNYIFQRETGEMECYSWAEEDGPKFYQLDASGKWKEDTTLKPLSYPDEMSMNSTRGMEMVNGNIFVLYTTMNNELSIAQYGKDGNPIFYTTLKENNKPVTVGQEMTDYRISQEGDIFIATNGDAWAKSIKCYDGKTGELKKQYDIQACDYQVVDHKLYALTIDSIMSYDLESGETLDTIKGIDGWIGKLIPGKEVGEWYLKNQKGIFHLAPKGNIWEEVLDSQGTLLGDKGAWVSKLFVQNDTYFAVFPNQTGTNLKMYYYDENLVPKRKLTIYMQQDNECIRAAAYVYQKQYPDVSVEIQTLDGSVSGEDSVKALNTALLAGEGPDMMVLDYLPITTYIDKGILLDISDLAEQPLANKEWNSNIVEAFKVDNKYYALPTRFVVPMLWGKEDLISKVSTIEDLAKYKEEHPEAMIWNKTKLEIFAQFRVSCIPTCINKDGSLNSEKLRSFLTSVDTLATQQYDENKANEYFYDNQLEPPKYKELLDMTYKVTDLATVNPRHSDDVMVLTSTLRQRGEGSTGVLKDDEKVYFEAKGILGVNANSPNQDIAKEIIKIALGEQCQTVISPWGNPINLKAMAAQKEKVMTVGVPYEIKDTEGRRVNIESKDDERYKQVEECWEEANSCDVLTNMTLYNAIYTNGKAYCKGEITLEDAIAETQKVSDFR